MLPGIYPAQLSGADSHRPWAAPIPDAPAASGCRGVAGASRQTRIRALLLSIRNTLFRRSCRFLILLRFRFFSSAASFCLHLFHGPGFLFPSAEAAAAPLFRFSIPFQPEGSFAGKVPGLPRHGQGRFLRIRRIPRRSRRPGKISKT